MAVLKVGDWVVVEDKLRQVNNILNDHIFLLGEWGFFFPHEVTKLDDAVVKILTSVNKESK